MTTFQDPPPHSRRAVRQSERGEGSAPTPDQAVPYAFDPAAADPSQPPATTPPHTGRRAQLPPAQDSDAAPGFEPLTYSTQGRVSPPTGDHSQQPLASAPPPGGPDQAGYRVRDFSPEGGRRSAAPRDPAPGSPLSSPASFPAPARAVDLDYQTQGVPPAPSHSAANIPVEETLNHTLSRRELREMRAAAEQQAPPLQMPPAHLPEPIDTLLNSGPIEIPTLAPPPGQSQALAEAMAEFDMLTRSRREAEARARDAQVASLATPIVLQQPVAEPPAAEQPAIEQSAVEEAAVQPQPSVPAPPVQETNAPQPSAPAPTSAPASQLVFPPVDSAPEVIIPASAPVPGVHEPIMHEPVMQEPIPEPSAPDAPMLVSPVFLEPDMPQSAPADQQPSPAEPNEHGGRSPRASNHWRVQAAIEDDELPYENTLSRTVGSNTSAITTSALVLPSVPQPDSMLGSLSATGEILVTGSINLPRSLGSTGAHPDRVDNSDYEEDPFDSQVAAPDSAPVRAIRAISSNTSTRGVIETKKPQGNRLLTGVIITASVLCVGLLGLLIFAFATGKL
jgi:hypothetical protein